MSEMLRLTPSFRRKTIELSIDEHAQLNTIIDLLIPSDNDFPPPSSLQLIDEFLRHLTPRGQYKTNLLMSEKRLRTMLQELNVLADGNFCRANMDKQQTLLRNLERRDPALYQTLWTLANHSYYASLANRLRPQLI